MSFNKHDIIIDRNNYEEYFLLYIDDELTVKQVAAVETFAALHPDLQEELSILLTTKLNADHIFFEEKQQLFSDNIKMSAVEESLLLYIDNELSFNEMKEIDQQIETDSDIESQYLLLQKTKLDTADKIIFSYKAQLYHKTSQIIRPIVWLRIAAAILLILSMSILWWANTDNKPTTVVAIKW